MSGDCGLRARALPRWLIYLIFLGLYLTFRGYHSFDGDQAYRLPLLLHRQNPQLYADDPFVKAFEAFNPHLGSLLVLDLATTPFGLSAGLFLLFVVTFGATCAGIDRLARGIWPERGAGAGLIAIGLVLAAKAGNIGTNHLFEAMVLDRLIAFAMGWLALAQLVVQPERGRALVIAAVGVATVVHPSAGLQLGVVLAASWIVWALLRRWTAVSLVDAVTGCAALALAVVPGLVLNLSSQSGLMGQMPERDFWLLSVELQSPQHMLPHLWRMPQWLACGSYLALAGLAVCTQRGREQIGPVSALPARSGSFDWPAARLRLAVSLAVIVAGLIVAWYLIERLHSVRVTVFQPFRMATIARGIALIFVSGQLARLWRTGRWLPRMRAILIAVAVSGDWLMVVVTLAELAVSAAEALRARVSTHPLGRVFDAMVYFSMLALGLNFLGHHDTEYGHIPLLAGLAAGALVGLAGCVRRAKPVMANWTWTPRRLRMIIAVSWAAPAAAILVALIPVESPCLRNPLVRYLNSRCRFAAIPADDVERLGVWCRDHTPLTARFIGPPGPKTFRLWSQRSLAFNRSASPYDASGLSDWFARFQDHVGFRGRAETFVQEYVSDRHGFESRYDRLSDSERIALAQRQGADYIVAPAPERSGGDPKSSDASSRLELLHVEGRYAVYRLNPEQLAQRQR